MISRSFKEKSFFLLIITSLVYSIADAVITDRLYLILLVYVLASIQGLIGNNIALHRYFSHSSFKTSKFKERLLACWSILPGLSMGPIAFAGIHGHHHIHSDTDKDVHSPISKKWWYVASGLVILDFKRERITWTRDAKRLLTDPFLKFIEYNYFFIWGCIILVAYLIGGSDLVIYGFLAPAGWWVFQGNILVNFLGHFPSAPGAYTNFDNKDYSTNNKIINWITWGEGLQNNHHKHPRQYNHAMKPGEFDPAGFIIKKFFSNDNV